MAAETVEKKGNSRVGLSETPKAGRWAATKGARLAVRRAAMSGPILAGLKAAKKAVSRAETRAVLWAARSAMRLAEKSDGCLVHWWAEPSEPQLE